LATGAPLVAQLAYLQRSARIVRAGHRGTRQDGRLNQVQVDLVDAAVVVDIALERGLCRERRHEDQGQQSFDKRGAKVAHSGFLPWRRQQPAAASS
jgi:hypothetical protein